METEFQATWVIPHILARSCRPGYPATLVRQSAVDAWLVNVRALGIQSVICLLAEEQLAFYRTLPTDLISYYRQAGLAVTPVPVRDHLPVPLSAEDLARVEAAYSPLPKPVLVHCSAGVDRTGRAVRYLAQLAQRTATLNRFNGNAI